MSSKETNMVGWALAGAGAACAVAAAFLQGGAVAALTAASAAFTGLASVWGYTSQRL